MIVSVRVHPKSSQEKVVQKEDGSLEVWLHAPAIDGKANHNLIGMLAQYYRVPKTTIVICKGVASNQKVVIIPSSEDVS